MNPREPIWSQGSRRLRDDPAFGPVVERLGPVRLQAPAEDHFHAVSRSIVHQQLAGAAARSIHERFVEAIGGDVTPSAVLAAGEEMLRAAGLSRNKARALCDLAGQVESGVLPLDDIGALPDQDIVALLTGVWGVGRWTAEMFLLFQLRRPDVWPVGDLGVREGFKRILALAERPTVRELELMGVGYRPWRSTVAWYCWRILDGPTET